AWRPPIVPASSPFGHVTERSFDENGCQPIPRPAGWSPSMRKGSLFLIPWALPLISSWIALPDAGFFNSKECYSVNVFLIFIVRGPRAAPMGRSLHGPRMCRLRQRILASVDASVYGRRGRDLRCE